MKTSKIFVVDDHPIVRYGIVQAIQQEADLVVCGEAGTLLGAKQNIQETQPDAVLVDISLHDNNGIDLIKELAKNHPHCSVLVVSMYDELQYIKGAMQAGAKGYFHKDDEIANIPIAIRKILNQERYFSNSISLKLMECSSNEIEQLINPAQLTRREMDIMARLAEGKRRQQIADELNISTKTYSVHVENIKKKLNLPSSDEVTQYAIRWIQNRFI